MIYIPKIINYFVNNLDLDLDDRKTFERKETTETILSKIDEILEYVKK